MLISAWPNSRNNLENKETKGYEHKNAFDTQLLFIY